MRSAAANQFGYDLDKLFKDLENETHILVAVSGGSDSVALLHLLNDWAKGRASPKLSVATIDHGLRAESAHEAKQVGHLATKLGLPHIIERWADEKPESALSQMAREARYALLSKIARSIGATAIALGHNLDDQRETVLMRAKRVGHTEFESTPDNATNLGLAGMQSYSSYCGPPEFEPVGLVRPVLSIARAKLRLFLESIGESWIDDPSNEDDHYERVRLRQELVAHTTRYPTAIRISKFANEVAARRECLANDCAQFIGQHVRWQPNSGLDKGIVVIERVEFIRADKYLMRHLLRVLIGVAGGRNFFISPDKAMQLVLDIQAGSQKSHSIGSAIIAPQSREILIWRENRNLPKQKLTEADANLISWDGRIIYLFPDDHSKENLVLRALGKDGLESIETQLQRKLETRLRQSLLTQPAVFKCEKLVFAPLENWCAVDFSAPDFKFWSPSLEQFQPDCDFKLIEKISQLRYPVSQEPRIV